MPSSAAASSSSSLEVIGDSVSRSVDQRARVTDTGEGDAMRSKARTVAEHIVSYLRTQREVDELCGSYGVPGEFKARPAGELRMSSTPPPGHVCLCAHALSAGMRVPLHPFFSEVLRHYRLAPTQLAPNGWRDVVGFVVLCHFAGVPPSLPLFSNFFSLSRYMGWYHFRSRNAAGVLFTGAPSYIKDWKQGYFFLSSPAAAPWPCPVEWGVPPQSSTTELPLTIGEKSSAAKLLRVRGSAAIDLQTYLCDSNLAAAMIAAASPPTPPPCARTQSPRTTEPSSVYDVMKIVRAEKAAAEALAAGKKVETEPGLSPLSGKKRNFEESSLGGPPPPGFSVPRNQGPDGHDGDAAGWEAARKLLQDLVTPSRASVFAAAKPSDVVAATYMTMLQAANYASFSLGHAMELEEKHREAAAEAGALRAELEKSKAEVAGLRALRGELEKTKAEVAEAGALRGELEKTKAELGEARKTAAGDLESAKAAAVRDYLASTENVRRLAEHALEGYERGMRHMKRVALRLYPQVDAARLVVPLGGPPSPP